MNSKYIGMVVAQKVHKQGLLASKIVIYKVYPHSISQKQCYLNKVLGCTLYIIVLLATNLVCVLFCGTTIPTCYHYEMIFFFLFFSFLLVIH